MLSGGFSNQSLRGLVRDLAAGLPLLSWRQWQLVRRWARQGDPLLAVGDLLPLLLAWSGGGRFGFIGTPKSDYTWAELGLATAGTATEQLVGLGSGALSLPGPGPQFKLGFAQRQSRLLGGAVEVCRTQEALAERLQQLLRDPAGRLRLGAIGRRRMGQSGGSEALAALVEELLLA